MASTGVVGVAVISVVVSDVYVVALTCFNAQEDKKSTSSSSATITVHVDSSIRSSSSYRSSGGQQCISASVQHESQFVIAENMHNVTLGRLQCRHPVFCTAPAQDKYCTLTVLGTSASQAIDPFISQSVISSVRVRVSRSHCAL